MQHLRAITFRSDSWKQEVLSLYRRILHMHQRKLVSFQKALGDNYVKTEFRLHKKATQTQAIEFMKQWDDYRMQLEVTPSIMEIGKELPEESQDLFTNEQKEQLEKLKEETAKVRQQLQSVLNEMDSSSDSRENLQKVQSELAQMMNQVMNKK